MNFEDYASGIGKRLKEVRLYRHYKQEDIAKYLFVSLKAYQSYEQSQRIPPLEKLLSLCELYRITPNELLGYDEMARVAVICDKYDIRYKTNDDGNIVITSKGAEYIIPKSIFTEIIFKSERMINHVAIQSEHLQKLREYEACMIKDFIDYEIYFSGKDEYTLKEMDKDLKRIEVLPVDESKGGKK